VKRLFVLGGLGAAFLTLPFLGCCNTQDASTNSGRKAGIETRAEPPTSPLPDSFRGVGNGAVTLDSLPRYTGYSFYVILTEGYTVSDLKRLDEESGLPLSSATYDSNAAYGGRVVVKFGSELGNRDPEQVVAALEHLPPVARATPVPLWYTQ